MADRALGIGTPSHHRRVDVGCRWSAYSVLCSGALVRDQNVLVRAARGMPQGVIKQRNRVESWPRPGMLENQGCSGGSRALGRAAPRTKVDGGTRGCRAEGAGGRTGTERAVANVLFHGRDLLLRSRELTFENFRQGRRHRRRLFPRGHETFWARACWAYGSVCRPRPALTDCQTRIDSPGVNAPSGKLAGPGKS